MGYASNLYEAQKETRASYAWQMMRRLEQDSWFETLRMFGSVIFFVFVLFVPGIAKNGLTEWLFRVIDWAFNLPIIGWLIGIGGVLFLLGIIFYGIFAFGMIVAIVVEKFKSKKPESEIILETDQTVIEEKDVYEKYIDKENLSGSLANINQLLDSSSDNRPELLDAKAEILNLLNKTDEAIRIYNKILEIDKNYANAYVALATIYQAKEIEENKNYSSVIVELLKKLENIKPEKVSYYVLAGALKNKGDFEEALQCYEKAIEQKKDDNYFLEDIYSDIAKILTKQKKYPEAIEAYDNAIKCSIKEYGNDSYCSEIYAFKREIYELMGDSENVKEMDRKFSAAEKLYVEKAKSSQDECYDEKLANIHKKLEKLGEQEHAVTDNLYNLVLLTLEERYPSQDLPDRKIDEVIDGILEEVEYDKDIRAIEKARLVKRIKERNKYDTK
jgi:tetratricopeptide (TPR) repeat protein